MSLTLGTFASGAVINATTIRERLSSIELYLNEQSLAADRGTAWLQSNHVYRPDFYGSPNPHTTLTSGESYFRQRSDSDQLRSWWSRYLGESATGYFPVPGLTATVQIPENINANGGHRTRIFASFYAYEFGGVDGNMDETSPQGARFALTVDGTVVVNYDRPIYKGSSTSADEAYAFYPRKQVSIIDEYGLDAGIHHFGVAVSPNNQGTNTKHVVVVQGNLIVRYWCR